MYIYNAYQKNKGKKWLAFSVASVKEESLMFIGTRSEKIRSATKKALVSMKKGDKIHVRGPFGWFKVIDKHPL